MVATKELMLYISTVVTDHSICGIALSCLEQMHVVSVCDNVF